MARQSPVSKDAGFLHAIIEREALAHGNAQGFAFKRSAELCPAGKPPYGAPKPRSYEICLAAHLEATTARITTPVSRVTATGIRSMRISDTASLFLWSWVLSYDQIINDERSLLH